MYQSDLLYSLVSEPHYSEGDTEKWAHSPQGGNYLPPACLSHVDIPTPPLSPSTHPSQPFRSRSATPTKPLRHSIYPHSTHVTDAVFFPNAHNFTINNSTFVTHTTNTMSGENNTVLLRFTAYIFIGAEFDASERDPPPTCHPGTRLEILKELDSWQKHPFGQGKPVAWLRGPAGVGKTAIMQTFAEDLSPQHSLGASLFLSKSSGRSDPTRIIPTLAYQLAIHTPEYRTRFVEIVEQDPSIPRKSMRHQFSKLISEPFANIELFGDDRTRLILIDGLDECDGEEAQRELVRLIALFTREYSGLPLRWIISSRPEPHLKQVFGHPGMSSTVVIHEVLANGSKARKDVETYLHHSFKKIRDDFPDIVPLWWPTSRQFLIIADAAGGLFAFAATVMRYVGEGRVYGDPVGQLESVITDLNDRALRKACDGPFHALDTLYTHILSKIPTSLIPTLHLILGFYLLKGNTTPPSLLLTANILCVRQNDLYHTLQRLHSVLDVPPPQEAHKKSLRFFHKSFPDYLTDKGRSENFWLDMGKQGVRIATCYIHVLELLPEPNDRSCIPLSWKHPADNNVEMQLLTEVKQHWFQLLPKVALKLTDQDQSSELQSLISTINKLRFNAFDVTAAYGFINLINWTSSSSHPLWNQLIFEELRLESFSLERVDTSRASVFYRTRPDRWGYWSMGHSLDTSSFGNYTKYFERHSLTGEEFLKEFNALGESSSSLNPRVLIIGHDPTKRCAVVLTSTIGRDIQPVIRYYFPLKF